VQGFIAVRCSQTLPCEVPLSCALLAAHGKEAMIGYTVMRFYPVVTCMEYTINLLENSKKLIFL
jgi:hypothetical protein